MINIVFKTTGKFEYLRHDPPEKTQSNRQRRQLDSMLRSEGFRAQLVNL